ncbi:MAG: RagB/SusD family nutrient uptake outer membrane protein [Tannerellaceae bacterium]|nr:RagB/SusD family nutrient uptake outer membrane protein [Tannerellaceae bacterium]
MKYIKKSIFAFCCLGLVSCADSFLEQNNPNRETIGDFWKNETELMEGLSAAYRPLRFNGLYSRWLHVLYISRSDEGYSLSSDPNFASYSSFLTRNNDSTEGVLYPWLDMYKGIFWANQVLDNAPEIEGISESLRERIIGEASFLRGMGYFHLAGTYGRGPISLSSMAGEEREIGEKPDLYEQARKDFELAAEAGRLPNYYDNANVDRVTRRAALGMLAKVYVQQKNWNKVEELCHEIFNLQGANGQPAYDLVANYVDNFKENTENNSESLFEVQFDGTIYNGIELGCQRAKFFGLPGPSFDDVTPSDVVKTDLEKEKTIDGKTDPRLKATLFYYDEEDPDELLYGMTWRERELNDAKVYWRKYTNYDTQDTEGFNSGINYRVLRLADMYLLYAEALNELGRTGEAYAYINKVRNRVNLPNLENSTVFTGIGNDQAKMREQIMHERFCELAGECWRWMDLERWGMFEDQLKINWLASRDFEFENFTIGKSDRFPIPYREIPLVDGLVQNPGF